MPQKMCMPAAVRSSAAPAAGRIPKLHKKMGKDDSFRELLRVLPEGRAGVGSALGTPAGPARGLAQPATAPPAQRPSREHPPLLAPPAGPERECLGPREEGRAVVDLLDPLVRVLVPAGVSAPAEPTAPAPPPNAVVAMDQLVARLVRRIAWGGDGRRGSVRIEIGAGELAGATIVIHAEGREVSVEADLPAGVAAEAWRERVGERLRQRGLEVSELEVR